MNWRRSIAMFVTLCVLAMPAAARADDDDAPAHDARTEGFEQKVQVEKSSVALVWIAFLLLSLIFVAALFKDAKRTHLD